MPRLPDLNGRGDSYHCSDATPVSGTSPPSPPPPSENAEAPIALHRAHAGAQLGHIQLVDAALDADRDHMVNSRRPRITMSSPIRGQVAAKPAIVAQHLTGSPFGA